MIELRLLGELEVLRDGSSVPLPASKKSRALLAYLAATGRPQSRERLCELLWDGPDDPRAQLRWSLTKLRPVLDDHLAATRDRVALQGVSLDCVAVAEPSRNATVETLETLAAMFRGEFLEGLDLPRCFRFQQWCAGERERLRRLHVSILDELTRRLGQSEAALRHARRRVAIDPFADDAHAALIRLLAALGAHDEALRQYEATRQMFERELGARPGQAIEEARRKIGSPRTAVVAAAAPLAQKPFVGRAVELARIASASRHVLVLGEPGIGKTRLLCELSPDLYGRAFASEMVRPYGVWIDALGDFTNETDRERLFDSVARRVSGVIAIDDIQWVDEASAALLHYVARKTDVRFVLAARVGEIDDNRHATQLVRDLGADTVRLGPLAPEDTRALVNDARIAEMSGGNPLFALELARSGAAGGALPGVIAGRLERLDGASRELVAWAAAAGREFDIEIVGRATGMPAGEMLAALEKLERSAIVRAVGDRRYDFTHDLVREAAYQMMSAPRRVLIHRHIARALRETHDRDAALAGEIVHHASLAGDYELAATAAIAAGQRCLRLFAYGDATSVARRGLEITASVETEVRLLEVIVLARVPLRERVTYTSRIVQATERARREELPGVAALGAHLLAILYEESNDYGGAATSTVASADASRVADPVTAALAIAGSARCLLYLQREIPRAEMLIAQAQALGIPNLELSLAIGYLHAHRGRAEEAIPHLEESLRMAAARQDHWREWAALMRLITISLEEGDAGRALERCAALGAVAAKMSGGSEPARAAAIEAISRHANGERADVDRAVAELRAADSQSDLAWALSFLASIERDTEAARRYAEEALRAAETVGRESEAAIARCLLGLPAKRSADLTARAKQFVKERKHGHPRARAVV
jgi:DNA-binding SARP family transcriptional activator